MIWQSFITACDIVVRIVLDEQNATGSGTILTQSIDKGCVIVAQLGVLVVKLFGISTLLELLGLFLGVEDIGRVICG